MAKIYRRPLSKNILRGKNGTLLNPNVDLLGEDSICMVNLPATM